VLEHGRVGVVAGFGEQGGEQAVASGLADMQGFDHGAKIGLHTRGKGGRDGEGNGKSFLVEANQVTDGGGGAEDAYRRGGVPTLVVVVEVDGAGQADLGLDAEHVGLDELRAGEAALLGDRQKGRDEGSGLVTAHRLAEIVVVQRVRRRTVEEGGIERRGLALCAEQGARPRRPGDAGGTEQVGGAGSTEPARVTPIVSMIAVLESLIACLVTFLSPNERMRSARR
jgi:hypothetical protein